ncbi:hypothetical protein PRO82_000713 [Candidatus Protochlamydia amoebophila]|nr:hypothetical protein [Candidatus Protochlamydia amoebophila]
MQPHFVWKTAFIKLGLWCLSLLLPDIKGIEMFFE